MVKKGKIAKNTQDLRYFLKISEILLVTNLIILHLYMEFMI